jgi:pimeloyl-ACP methyl ester carboxylesterase
MFPSATDPKPVMVAVHGILTGQTSPSWPDHFDAWMFQRDPEVKVLKKEYSAGPFPRWNCWVKNPRLAESLANEVELLLRERAARHTRGFRHILPPTWFLAHSNGALIALLAAKRLIARGCWVGGLILTGAACSGDVVKSGVASMFATGRLGVAIAYCSTEDRVLPGERGVRGRLWALLAWPYGSLGRTGWMRQGKAYQPSLTEDHILPVFTRWFRGGHGAYFAPNQREKTFEMVAGEVGREVEKKAEGRREGIRKKT